jgi:hypothetical protein
MLVDIFTTTFSLLHLIPVMSNTSKNRQDIAEHGLEKSHEKI